MASFSERKRRIYDAVSFQPDAAVPFADKLALGCGVISTNGPFVVLGFFLMYFYTDVLGLSGSTAASIILFARIFDALTDLMMGWLIDKYCLKWGKYRSWLLFSIPLQLILFILIFTALPDSRSSAQIALAWASYALYWGVASTMCFIPMSCMITNEARNQNERASIAVIRGIIKMIIRLSIIASFLPAVEFTGGGDPKRGYFITGAALSVLFALPVIWVFLSSRKYELNLDGSCREHLRTRGGDNAEKISLRRQISDLFHNRPAMVMVVSTFVLYILDAVRSGTIVYLYNYYFNRPELASAALFFNAATAIAGSFCVKAFIKLFRDSNRAYIITMLGSAAMYTLWFAIIITIGRKEAGEMMRIGHPLFVLYALCGFLQGAHIVFPEVMLPQAVDYGMWKHGRSQAGLIFASASFCLTIGGAAGASLLGVLLDTIGYTAGMSADESVLHNLLLIGVMLPSVLTLVQAFIQSLTGLDDKKHAQCVAEITKSVAAL